MTLKYSCLIHHQEEVPESTTISFSNDSDHSLSIPNASISSNLHAYDTQQHQGHPMITRSKNNIFKPKRTFIVSKHPLLKNPEPSNIHQTMQRAHWRNTISKEFEALLRHGTWSLVPPPKGHNIVGCKWLFRIKCNVDGSFAKYKARLVAEGFTQCPKFDFKDTFASNVRPQTIKIIITIALTHKWEMHQLDVINAFLQCAP